jgi:hypothetical protein
MRPTPHIPFKTLAVVYILIKMHLAPHVPFETLAMAYNSFQNAPSFGINIIILIKMHLVHNNIPNASFETQTKIHYGFQIMENLFHYNPM